MKSNRLPITERLQREADYLETLQADALAQLDTLRESKHPDRLAIEAIRRELVGRLNRQVTLRNALCPPAPVKPPRPPESVA